MRATKWSIGQNFESFMIHEDLLAAIRPLYYRPRKPLAKSRVKFRDLEKKTRLGFFLGIFVLFFRVLCP